MFKINAKFLNGGRLKLYCAGIAILTLACTAWAAGTYSATNALEHAILATSNASYENITVTKTGDTSGQSDDYDFKGTNAAILASSGATLTITGSATTIQSNATYGNAVFAYGGGSGDGTTINISDATITTSKHNSGGIMVTGGGKITASNLTITTSEGSSAAIRSDRGGGTINVTGGTYTANGSGSPAIYSTADISVSNATLNSGVAQGIVIEGGNSVKLTGCTVNANNTKLNSSNDKSYQGVLIYQSMSGDASEGNSTFTMSNGTLTNANGDVFLVTNTTCTINLSGATIKNNGSGVFLRAATGSWGSSPSNGGKVTLNASGQTITGDIYVDNISTLTLNLKDKSTFTGAFTNSNPSAATVVVENGSTWTVTANSYLTSFTNNGTVKAANGAKLYVNGTEQKLDSTTTDGDDDSSDESDDDSDDDSSDDKKDDDADDKTDDDNDDDSGDDDLSYSTNGGSSGCNAGLLTPFMLVALTAAFSKFKVL